MLQVITNLYLFGKHMNDHGEEQTKLNMQFGTIFAKLIIY